MVPYKYDYRIYLLAETLKDLENQVEEEKRPKPLGYQFIPRMNYTRIFNKNFQDVASYYNLTTNEQKLDLLNYIITHNFYIIFDEDEECNEIFEYPETIVMSEFNSDQIWNVIAKHIKCFSLKEPPRLIW